MTNSLTLRVAADAWKGNPNFTVTVDGRQIGGVQVASASHAKGRWQNITIKGDFGASPSKVAVSFINDAWGGTSTTDRNLYVQSLTLNGRTYLGSALPATLGPAKADSAALFSNGTITFDTAAPTAGSSTSPPAPPPPALAAPTISAFSAPLTNSPRPTISGTAGANERISIFEDGGATAIATVASDSTGAWSCLPATSLTDGTHNFTASASDMAGGTSPMSGARSVTVDTTAPSERVTSLSVAGDDIVDASEGGAQGISVSGTLSAALAPGDSITVTLGGTSTVVPSSGVQDRSFAFTAPKPGDGWTAGTAVAQVRDAAGNASEALSQAFGVSASTDPSPSAGSPAGPSGKMSMLGVNLSGAEYSADKLPGVVGTDYTYPTTQEIDYLVAKGLNVIRLPFLWERAQPTEDGPLSQAELGRLDAVVDYANSKGMKVILDPHDYGSGFGNLIGSAGTPTSAFADFWGKLAAHYASNSDVMFGLMNEPYQQSASNWLTDANAAIASIRKAGAVSQEVLVPGSYWDGANTWTTTDNASVVGAGVVDPAHNFVFEVHQYLDADGSGTHVGVVSPTIGSSRLGAITQWARDTGSRLFLGEFGVAQDQTSLSALDDMLGFMAKNSDVWQGGTEWAAGSWLGDNIYTIEPTGLGTGQVTDKPQMNVLQKYSPGLS